MEKWAVIACDQHTSEPEYWNRLDEFIGDSPSTLRLMLPEAFLSGNSRGDINAYMHQYLNGGVFRNIEDSFIYVERTLKSGKVRKGLVGALNLSEYGNSVKATEATVQDRLPPRIEIRRSAPFEMPHIMVFVEDEIKAEKHELLYDFELNAGGGHIRGYRADSDINPLRMAVGDGNHSLAAAQACGDRYALVEVVDINDDAVEFEPIHRVILGTDTSSLKDRIMHMDDVAEAQAFCDDYVSRHGGRIDYIHNDSTALELGLRPGNAAVMLTAFDKMNLFDDIFSRGPYPKKSFSIGHAEDKRYYLECRLRNND